MFAFSFYHAQIIEAEEDEKFIPGTLKESPIPHDYWMQSIGRIKQENIVIGEWHNHVTNWPSQRRESIRS